MIVTYPQLKALYDACDNNNPKMECNYICIDLFNMIAFSTNTRVLTICYSQFSDDMENKEENKDKFYFISKNIVKIALTQKKTKEFLLSNDNEILCNNEDGFNNLTLKVNNPYPKTKSFNPIEIDKILNKFDPTKNIKYFSNEQIEGILASNDVFIEPKLLSKEMKIGDIQIQDKRLAKGMSISIPCHVNQYNDITNELSIKQVIMPTSKLL